MTWARTAVRSCIEVGGVQGQGEGKAAAHIVRAGFNPDLAAMRLDGLLAKGQTEAGAGRTPAPARALLHTVELVEDIGPGLRRDTRPGIGHAHQHIYGRGIAAGWHR